MQLDAIRKILGWPRMHIYFGLIFYQGWSGVIEYKFQIDWLARTDTDNLGPFQNDGLTQDRSNSNASVNDA